MGPFDFIAWRNKLGFSQAGMAQHLGVSRETINRWEKGKQPVPAKYDTSGNAAAVSAKPVVQKNYPDLYRKSMYKAALWVKRDIHPDNLLGPCMAENEFGETVQVPWSDDVLRSQAYIEARAAKSAELKAKDERAKTMSAEVHPDALPGETLFDYNKRHGL